MNTKCFYIVIITYNYLTFIPRHNLSTKPLSIACFMIILVFIVSQRLLQLCQ